MSQLAYLPTVGKREQTKVQNRQAILDAAREVFGELGYETATVRDIIRRTGLAAGTFYNYYRSKEEVFASLADDGARRFSPILKALRAEHGEFEGFLYKALKAYFDFIADEHESWMAKRPPDEPHVHVHGETPEMAAVFSEVKASVAGYGQADKRQMQVMVRAQLNMRELPEPSDAADALAVALCHLQAEQLARRFGVDKSELTTNGARSRAASSPREHVVSARSLRIQPER